MPVGPAEVETVKLTHSAVDENGRYNNILAKIKLKEAYDIQYGIYDHDDPALGHPLQYHLMVDQKRLRKYGMYREYLRRYHVFQIQKYFGLSFIEFMNQPITEVDDMFEVSIMLSEKESMQLAEAERRAEEESKRIQGAYQNNDTPQGILG